MKTLTVFTILFAAFIAKASDESLNHDVLLALVKNPTQVTLTDAAGKALEEKYQIPSLIADALSQNYAVNGAQKVLSMTTVECKRVTVNTVGADAYNCNVSFGNGDFSQKGESLVGPDTESSISFDLKVSVPVVPKAKPTITSKKVVATLAG